MFRSQKPPDTGVSKRAQLHQPNTQRSPERVVVSNLPTPVHRPSRLRHFAKRSCSSSRCTGRSDSELCLSDDEFRIAAALRLGAPATARHKCKCGLFAAADWLHALICPKIKQRFTRHNNCNVLVKEALKTAKTPSTLDLLGYFARTAEDQTAEH